VSEGNAEQSAAQTHARQAVQVNPERPAPRDPYTGNGSQSQRPVSQEGPIDERSTPQVDAEQQNSNGQKKDDREEQLASAPQGRQPGVADPGNTVGRQSPWTAAHVQRTAGRNAAGLSSAPPAQSTPGQTEPGQAQAGQAPSSQQRPPQPQPATQASHATPPQPPSQPQPQARTFPAPAERPFPSERPAQPAVPVWDPPPPQQPKQSLRARLGIAKKGAQPEGDSPAAPGAQDPAATSVPPQTPPSATAAGATGGSSPIRTPAPQAPTPPQQRPEVKPGPPAPPVQPSGQLQGRTDDTTGRTPPIPGGARPAQVAPTPRPQARMPAGPVVDPATRMPSAPTLPGAPGPFPVPAPVQALRESATQTGPAVPAAAAGAVHPAGMPEAYHPAKPKVGVARRTRKARLRLSRLDPWSVMKTSFLFSIAAGIMLVVAVYSIWTVLSTSGLFESINEIVRSVVSTPGDTTPFRIEEYINTQKVMGVTALIACVDVVIFTALATLGSFLYNLAATMLGGLEITLAED
jgi:hypothetical protein